MIKLSGIYAYNPKVYASPIEAHTMGDKSFLIPISGSSDTNSIGQVESAMQCAQSALKAAGSGWLVVAVCGNHWANADELTGLDNHAPFTEDILSLVNQLSTELECYALYAYRQDYDNAIEALRNGGEYLIQLKPDSLHKAMIASEQVIYALGVDSLKYFYCVPANEKGILNNDGNIKIIELPDFVVGCSVEYALDDFDNDTLQVDTVYHKTGEIELASGKVIGFDKILRVIK